jgi:hypothetical protein
MFKSKMRLLSVSALVGAGLIAAGPVGAAQFSLGTVEVTLDTTLSVGASIVAADRETDYLPATNGGPVDQSIYFAEGVGALWNGTENKTSAQADAPGNGYVLGSSDFVTNCVAFGTFCQEVDGKENFDGSINTDDGRMNFDQGDVFSSVAKVTSDLYLSANNGLSALFRVSGFYDAILDDDTRFERDTNGFGYRDAVADLKVLDAYVSYDTDLGDMPATIRVGRQVINWGESTFFLGGNSVFSPIDVGALRRPGAEIKEALLPVEAVYGSLAVTENLSLEAYYGGWEEFTLDAGGTFNSNGDFLDGGGANGDRIFSGGSARSGSRIVCDPSALTAAGMKASAEFAVAILNQGVLDPAAAVTTSAGNGCGDKLHADVLASHAVGMSEYNRKNSNDYAYATLVDHDEGDTSFGLALRYYAENLNSTEFGLYYQKYDSRIPYFHTTTGRPTVNYAANGPTSSTLGRGVGSFGCYDGLMNANAAGTAAYGAQYTGAAGQHFYIGNTPSGEKQTEIFVDDPLDIRGAMRAALGTTEVEAALKANGAAYVAAGSALGAAGAGFVALGTVINPDSGAGYYLANGTHAPEGSVAEMVELYCMMSFAQINPGVDMTHGDFAGYDAVGQLPTGAILPALGWEIDFHLEYPTIEVVGGSFATTLFGWGVQGEVAYRPNMPLSFDGDAAFINGIFRTCGLGLLGAVEWAYSVQGTYANGGCSQSSGAVKGYTTDYDVYNWDIGTTATFTRSNPIVSALGADIAILLTEFGGVNVDGIERERGTSGYAMLGNKTPLSGVCTSGNDLPLNGVLSIDTNPKEVCRPTDNSSGGLVYFQLQYNNVFGSPIALQPTVIYTRGLSGNSPSPAGFWREDVSSTALLLNFSYLDTIRGSVSYRMNDGEEKYTRNNDKDQIGVNISYAF